MTVAARWRETARDAASALFVPVVLILIPLNAVVIRNRQDLRYDPALVHDFLYAGIALWAIGFAIAMAGRARVIGRIWFALPWSILLLDVVGTSAQRHGVSLATAVSIDAAIVALVIALAILAPSRPLQTVAA